MAWHGGSPQDMVGMIAAPTAVVITEVVQTGITRLALSLEHCLPPSESKGRA
jgi:hypothetical protein